MDIFSHISKLKGKKNFIIGDLESTYDDFNLLCNKINLKLSQLKISGNRIGLLNFQGINHACSLVGTILSSNVSVLMSLEWTDYEIQKIIDHCEITYLLSDRKIFKSIETQIAYSFEENNLFLLKLKNKTKIKSKKEDAVIIYSSGTTGSPKGVLLSRKGISSNVKAVNKYLSLNPSDSGLIFTPTCYAFSLSQNLTHLSSKASLLPIKTKLLFPADILSSVDKLQITGVTGPPAAFNILVDNSKGFLLRSVRYAQVGGTPFSFDLSRKIAKTFKKAKVLNVYGCSENSPRVSFFRLNYKKSLSNEGFFPVGQSVKGTNIKIITSSNKRISKINEIGEVVLSGNSLMTSYWKNKELTRQKLKNNYFYTGDRGYIDKYKNLHLIGRLDTIINSGNEKISPEEVELVLLSHSYIMEAVVFPKKDEILGSRVLANIIINDKSNINLDEVKSFCRRFLSAYKVPREIFIVKEIKKNLYGKINRKYYSLD